jgi:TetR/AcrR family transcriptional repressor of multidrug resistance operon
MRPKDENKDLAIRQTALHMIVTEGFKGLSMQKLAKEAGVSPATIYIYYQDRNDLLHKLYLEVLDRTNEAALKGFDPDMSFDQGMKILWFNRFRYYSQYPDDFHFINQFINSPMMVNVLTRKTDHYKETMQAFYKNAVDNGEIAELQLEVYWPIAFAPLYQLINFSLQETIHPKPKMVVTEKTLEQTLSLVLKALKI